MRILHSLSTPIRHSGKSLGATSTFISFIKTQFHLGTHRFNHSLQPDYQLLANTLYQSAYPKSWLGKTMNSILKWCNAVTTLCLPFVALLVSLSSLSSSISWLQAFASPIIPNVCLAITLVAFSLQIIGFIKAIANLIREEQRVQTLVSSTITLNNTPIPLISTNNENCLLRQLTEQHTTTRSMKDDIINLIQQHKAAMHIKSLDHSNDKSIHNLKALLKIIKRKACNQENFLNSQSSRTNSLLETHAKVLVGSQETEEYNQSHAEITQFISQNRQAHENLQHMLNTLQQPTSTLMQYTSALDQKDSSDLGNHCTRIQSSLQDRSPSKDSEDIRVMSSFLTLGKQRCTAARRIQAQVRSHRAQMELQQLRAEATQDTRPEATQDTRPEASGLRSFLILNSFWNILPSRLTAAAVPTS